MPKSTVLFLGTALAMLGALAASLPGDRTESEAAARGRLDRARRAYGDEYEGTLKRLLATPPPPGIAGRLEGVQRGLNRTTAERLGTRSLLWMEAELRSLRDEGRSSGGPSCRPRPLEGPASREPPAGLDEVVRDRRRERGPVRAMRLMGEFVATLGIPSP